MYPIRSMQMRSKYPYAAKSHESWVFKTAFCYAFDIQYMTLFLSFPLRNLISGFGICAIRASPHTTNPMWYNEKTIIERHKIQYNSSITIHNSQYGTMQTMQTIQTTQTVHAIQTSTNNAQQHIIPNSLVLRRHPFSNILSHARRPSLFPKSSSKLKLVFLPVKVLMKICMISYKQQHRETIKNIQKTSRGSISVATRVDLKQLFTHWTANVPFSK